TSGPRPAAEAGGLGILSRTVRTYPLGHLAPGLTREEGAMRHAGVLVPVPARPRRQACAARPSRVPSARALPVTRPRHLRSTCPCASVFNSSLRGPDDGFSLAGAVSSRLAD